MSNQTEPAPYEPESTINYPKAGIVVGICGLLVDTYAITGGFEYLFYGLCIGAIGIILSTIGIADRAVSSIARYRKMAVSGLICSVVSVMPFIVAVFISVSEGHIERCRAACLSSTKQIGLAMRLYANDHDDKLPPTSNWHPLLLGHLKSEYHKDDVDMYIRCPSARDKRFSYGMNAQIGCASERELLNPTQTVFAFDFSLPVANANGGPETVDFRHRMKGRPGFANIVFVDGHAKTASEKKTDLPDVITIDQLQWKP